MSTITTDIGIAISVIQTVLPFVELAFPQVAAIRGGATAGIAAVQSLLGLIDSLHAAGQIDDATQAALYEKVNLIVSKAAFKGPEWQISTAAPTPPATPA